MNRIPYYPIFESEIVKRGIAKNEIASLLGISPRAFRNKLNGISPFTWPEVSIIHRRFFADMSKEALMVNKAERETQHKGA